MMAINTPHTLCCGPAVSRVQVFIGFFISCFLFLTCGCCWIFKAKPRPPWNVRRGHARVKKHDHCAVTFTKPTKDSAVGVTVSTAERCSAFEDLLSR